MDMVACYNQRTHVPYHSIQLVTYTIHGHVCVTISELNRQTCFTNRIYNTETYMSYNQ